MTKQKTVKTPLAIVFKKEHPDAYKAAYEKTLLDAFDTEHDTHENFRHLRARPCQTCNQESAFFYNDKCWRCFYAQEFYDHIETAIATRQLESSIRQRRLEYQDTNHGELTKALEDLTIT